MQRFSQKKIILLTLGLFTPVFLTTSKVNAGSFGAEIFCTMRDGGNDHESSWEAAYTYIKKQKVEFSKSHLNKQLHKLLNQLLEIEKNTVIVLNI